MIIIEDPKLARYLVKMGYHWKEVRTLGVFNKMRKWGYVFRDKERVRQLIILWEEGILG